MKIKVSIKDVYHGRVTNPADCMVARAVKKQTGLDNVVVTHSSIYLGDARAIIPVRVKQKIRRFDKFGFVLPFSFELTLTETERHGVQLAEMVELRRCTVYPLSESVRAQAYGFSPHKD